MPCLRCKSTFWNSKTARPAGTSGITELSHAFALCAASDEATEIRDDVALFQAVQAAPNRHRKNTPEQFDAAIHLLVSKAISTMQVIEELIKLAKDLDAATKRGKDMGLTDDEIAFYDAPASNDSAVQAMGDAKLKVIAPELITKVRQSVTIDWTLRESARAKINVIVKRILNFHGYPPDLQEEALKTVLMQAGAALRGLGGVTVASCKPGNVSGKPRSVAGKVGFPTKMIDKSPFGRLIAVND